MTPGSSQQGDVGLVFGGAGFIGRSTCAALQERGWRAVVADTTVATALPGLEVRTHDLGDSGIVFDVLDGDEKLFYVVPDELEQEEDGTRHYEKTIFTIFVTSPRLSVEGYSWRVGQRLDSAKDLMQCECWGSGEVTACSIRAHLAVIFEERCEAVVKVMDMALRFGSPIVGMNKMSHPSGIPVPLR
jgi:hypothetical protein